MGLRGPAQFTATGGNVAVLGLRFGACGEPYGWPQQVLVHGLDTPGTGARPECAAAGGVNNMWFVILAGLTLGRSPMPKAEPSWTAVSMPLYFHYFDGPSQTQPPANGPYTFYFPNPASGAPIPDQLGCTWQEYAPPYFFSNGAPLPNTIIERESPSVGTVFLTGSGSAEAIRGVGFLGQFTPGITSGQSNSIATVFYSTNDCYAGTLEYGFYYKYSANAAIFYFENNANCPSGSCFADLQGTVPVTDCSGGFALPVLPMTKGSLADGRNSQGTYEWNYRTFVFPGPPFYRMRVEALDPYTGEDGLSDGRGEPCIVAPNRWDSNNPLAPFSTCQAASAGVYAADTCDASFPMERLLLANGAVTAGVVKADDVAYPPASTPALQITEVDVAK